MQGVALEVIEGMLEAAESDAQDELCNVPSNEAAIRFAIAVTRVGTLRDVLEVLTSAGELSLAIP